MPRYVFEVAGRNGAQPPALELPNIQSARGEAVRAACKLLSAEADGFWTQGGDWQMTVSNEHGLTLFTLIFYATNAPVASATGMNGFSRLT
jgi:hypothetical protein